MPFLETDRGRAYYRHWAVDEPRAAVVFLHGFGEFTGLYHRYGFALNAAGIDLWAVDQFGHGLSPGDRGDFISLEASIGLADQLAALAGDEVPLIAQGHSFGAVATLWKLTDDPGNYAAGVVSGAPLVPVAGLLGNDADFDLQPSWLSADPFYLDSIENDPLAFVDGDGAPLARELDRAWDRFGSALPTLRVPTLAVHGDEDPVADVGAVRAYAEQIEALTLREIPGGRHDILNDVAYAEVAAAIIAFIDDVTSSTGVVHNVDE